MEGSRKGRVTRLSVSLAVGLAACAMLLASGPAASAGVPTTAPTASRPSQTSSTGSIAPGKLYGKLGQDIKQKSASDRMRVIVHLRDQVDLSKWSADDRPGAIRSLQAKAAGSQAALHTFLSQTDASASIYESYWIFNGLALEAPVSTLRALAARDDVAYIIEDGYMTLPKDPGPMAGLAHPDNITSNYNIYQVHAPETWALGFDGTGRVVANLDSGVDGNHQAFNTRWRGVQPGHSAADSWLDPFGISPIFPTATGSHGTHTMGTITGYFGDSTGPNEIGQAKGSTWIACRIYDNSGKGPFSYIHACFQYMLDPDGNPSTNDQPDAIGNSWGDTSSESFPDLEWWPDVTAWHAAGIIPVFSNANSGPGVGTVNEPGSYPISIGVGAVDINRTIASFSSRGPAEDLPPWNDPNNWERSDWNLIKPEVVAPGVSVRSSLPNNTYGNLSGTSMASPHVTGLAAMLRQIYPDLSVNEFYNIIIDTADFLPQWGTRPNNNYGWGEINDYAAAIYVRDSGTITGTITDASCNSPIVGADMRVYDNTPGSRAQGVGIRKLYSAATGGYRTILSAGTYTVTVSAPGFYGTTFSTTVMSNTTSALPIILNKMATGTITGMVSTTGGGPVAGVTISVNGLPNIHTTTDNMGQYTLSDVPAGTFTVRADKCGSTGQAANITVTYPGSVTHNFTITAPTSLLSDDFESGNLNNWTVTGGSATSAIWNNSTVRAMSGTHAARAGIPGQPVYTGVSDTYMVSATSYDASTADSVWLSYNLYDSAESEYDILRVQVSSDGGTTWTTVYGEASPVHGWQAICLDVTRWKSANMKIRFYFHSDANNWNNESFEGPSVDDVVFSQSVAAGSATNTPLPAMTPTPGSPIPCTPASSATTTPTQPASTPTSTRTNTPINTSTSTSVAASPTTTAPPTAVPPTVCPIQFQDVDATNTFYPYVRCLACRQILGGYPCGGVGEPCGTTGNPYFRPSTEISRGQIAKIVSQAAGLTDDPGLQRYADVAVDSPFYSYIQRLSNHEYMGGYSCGSTPAEPCDAQQRPYFRPSANASRGQLSKIVSNAAGFVETHSDRTYQDVVVDSTFYQYVERLSSRNVMGGYPCGDPGEPCEIGNKPYFRPNASVTRGQSAKIVGNSFFPNCQTP